MPRPHEGGYLATTCLCLAAQCWGLVFLTGGSATALSATLTKEATHLSMTTRQDRLDLSDTASLIFPEEALSPRPPYARNSHENNFMQPKTLS